MTIPAFLTDGWTAALVDHLWQSTVVAAIAWPLALMLKRNLKKKLVIGTAGLLVMAPSVSIGVVNAMQTSAPDQEVLDWQRAAGGKLEFEVASIRRAKAGTLTPSANFAMDKGETYEPADPHGRLSTNFPLAVYIAFAYKLMLTSDQIHSMLANLPKWVSMDSFVIDARAEGDPTKDQMRLMMQSLLADRFGLRVHFEKRQTPVLALVLKSPGKLGPKLIPHVEGRPCPAPGTPQPGDSTANPPDDVFPPICNAFMLKPTPSHTVIWGSRNAPMDLIASSLGITSQLGRPIVDQTGLTGTYDFSLEWLRESNSPQPAEAAAPPESQGPTFLEALGDQLGLKLEPARAPLDILVVDHIEQPSPN